MKMVEKTSARKLKVWWAFIWRIALIMMIFGLVFGPVAAFIAPSSRYDPRIVLTVLNFISALVSIPVGIAVMSRVLELEFSDFRLAMICESETTDDNA